MRTQSFFAACRFSLSRFLILLPIAVFGVNDSFAQYSTTFIASNGIAVKQEDDSKSASVENEKPDHTGLSYHTYETMLKELRKLEAIHPETCKVHDLGVSSDGETHMWALKISDNVEKEEDEPSVLLTGAIHGNERPAPEMALYTINYILENEANFNLINKTQIWVIPIMNSAGHAANTRENANRVDLNRGFPVDWKNDSLEGLEVETRNLIENFYNKRAHVVAGIDLHTYGQVYLLPYARSRNEPADYDALLALGEMMANSSGYRPMQLTDFIRRTVKGGGADYRYGKYGTFYYGLELGASHSPPADKLAALCELNLRGVMMMMNRVHYSTLTGHVTCNGKPIVATISIDGVDRPENLRLPYKSDTNFGRYYRILLPGKYKVTFRFEDIEIVKEAVEIVGDKHTVLNVEFGPTSLDDASKKRKHSIHKH